MKLIYLTNYTCIVDLRLTLELTLELHLNLHLNLHCDCVEYYISACVVSLKKDISYLVSVF